MLFNVWLLAHVSCSLLFTVIVAVQSVVSSSAKPWSAARQASLSFTVSQSLLKLVSIELMMPSNHLIPCCPLLLLPSISPTIGVFSNESSLRITRPKYWSFNISPSNEYSGLISFRINWLISLLSKGLSRVSLIVATIFNLLRNFRKTISG